ncbi:MAG: hypothetical protein B1H02_00340 [Candidatus Latescibacteria bacterium 4484_107]|nr:MAG: hypothetical protein B1H02_00340 [Candidatus Latescibacteria bacterium 4484_107]
MQLNCIIMVCMLLLAVQSLFAQNTFRYEYPVKPGAPEWRELSLRQKRAVQQIPENILRDMSTQELLQAWMDLPGRLEVLAFNTMQQGFDVTVKHYNVLSELLDREDAGSVVLAYYLEIDPSGMKLVWSSRQKGKFITDIAFVEFLLSQPTVLSRLSKMEKKQLLKSCVDNLYKKQAFRNRERNFFWVRSAIILAGRILENEKNNQFLQKISQDEDMKRALNTGKASSKAVYEKLCEAVINIAENYSSP